MFFLKELPTREILEAYHGRFPEMDVQAVEDALRLLRQASLLLREVEAYFASFELSQTRFLVLILLEREPGRDELAASELADKLDVSRPVVTRTIAGLEADGLVRTRPNQEDRRGKWVELTDRGRAKLQALLPGYYEILQRHMGRIKQERA